MKRALVAGTTLVLVVTAMVAAQDRDPFTGTWTLNVAKSTMVSPATASKSETVTYRHVNGEEVYTSDAVTAKGEAEHTDYRGVYDGPVRDDQNDRGWQNRQRGAAPAAQAGPAHPAADCHAQRRHVERYHRAAAGRGPTLDHLEHPAVRQRWPHRGP